MIGPTQTRAVTLSRQPKVTSGLDRGEMRQTHQMALTAKHGAGNRARLCLSRAGIPDTVAIAATRSIGCADARSLHAL